MWDKKGTRYVIILGYQGKDQKRRVLMKEPIILTKENKHMQVVEVKAYHLHDFNILAKFDTLCRLELIGGKIQDFKELGKLKNLCELKLGLVEVKEFTSITALQQITELSISGNQNYLIPSISKMHNLKQLSLDFCKIESLEGVENLQNLTSLSLGSVGEDYEISEIMNLRNLKRLKLTIPRKQTQWETDLLLESFAENFPKLDWLELDMKGKEFKPYVLRNLHLRHFTVTSTPFSFM